MLTLSVGLTLAVALTPLDEAKQLAEKQLAVHPNGKGASLRMTPPFPEAWPPRGQSVVYAYAARMGTGLHDAELTSQPWARYRVDGVHATLIAVDKAFGKFEPQGFFPITKEHPLIAKQANAERAILGATAEPTGDAASDVREYYCAWLAANGVVGKPIGSKHAAFVTWLGCKPR